MIDCNDLLEKVTDEVVISIMEENGSPLYRTSKDNRTQQECLWFRTICHEGDSSKLCYFTQTKDFYCYTNCGRMTFFDFIKRIKGYKDDEFYKCIQYVAEKVGCKISSDRNVLGGIASDKSLQEEERRMKKILERRTQKIPPNYELKVFDDTILRYFDHNTVYAGWVQEGISYETMAKYGISWYEYQKYIIIPHYDIDGRLIGIRRRSLKPEDADNKYMPLFIEGRSYEHPLGLNLYGLYQNKETIRKTKTAVLVEGEKSVLMGDTFYGDKNNIVATCGFNVSEYQMKLLKSLGVTRIYLGFDKDYDRNVNVVEQYKQDKVLYQNFQRYCQRLHNLGIRLSQYGFIVKIISDNTQGKPLLSIKDSPTDKGKAVFETLRKNAITVKVDSYG